MPEPVSSTRGAAPPSQDPAVDEESQPGRRAVGGQAPPASHASPPPAVLQLLEAHDRRWRSSLDRLSLSPHDALLIGDAAARAARAPARWLDEGNVSAEAMTFRATRGAHDDASICRPDVAVAVKATGVEVTAGNTNSVTLGLSTDEGAAGTLSVRDRDSDGERELCAKVSLGPVVVGACVETPL